MNAAPSPALQFTRWRFRGSQWRRALSRRSGRAAAPLQAQLLRVIQERQYKRVGSNQWFPHQLSPGVRHQPRPGSRSAARCLSRRPVLPHCAWRCRTPPLRERQGDILPLVRHFLAQLGAPEHERELDPAVRQYLVARSYPGNVRDLRQTVARIWHRHSGAGADHHRRTCRPRKGGAVCPAGRTMPSPRRSGARWTWA